MMSNSQNVTIFFSWQTDSPRADNMNLIEDCLKKAAKAVAKADSVIITVDRDTKGIGGSPEIVDAILAKIRSCDVFIWDATLVHKLPRPAPNSNVLLELGYAHAILGVGRLIGIMNIGNGRTPESLPFDLKHRRWPIQFNYRRPNWLGRLIAGILKKDLSQIKANIKQQLIKDLEIALREALNEPKIGAIQSDVDLHIGNHFWSLINSKWMLDWYSTRITHPQFEQQTYVHTFTEYLYYSDMPENVFKEEQIKALHNALLSAISNYLNAVSTEMISDDNANNYVITVKYHGGKRWIDDYDDKYEKQVNEIKSATKSVYEAWQGYIAELRTRYPEVIQYDS